MEEPGSGGRLLDALVRPQRGGGKPKPPPLLLAVGALVGAAPSMIHPGGSNTPFVAKTSHLGPFNVEVSMGIGGDGSGNGMPLLLVTRGADAVLWSQPGYTPFLARGRGSFGTASTQGSVNVTGGIDFFSFNCYV